MVGLLCMAKSAIFIDMRPGASFRQAMWALLVFLVTYCILNTKDGVMKNPHPGLWRALHGWNLWYVMIVVILLVLPAADGGIVMAWIFPDVDMNPKKMETLGYDHLTCRITQENVMRQFTSIWFLAHSVGWWAKMIMLRDLRICFVYSTAFEFTELTLQFLVPEFQECWWDSLIMDWLIANLLVGMMLGKCTLRWLQMRSFHWSPTQQTPYAAALLLKLSPDRWGAFQWNPANDPITMVLNSIIWIIMAIGEVNTFFLINILHLPRDHLFNPARQALFCLTAVPAVEEWYEYTRHVRAEYTTKYTFGKEWNEYKKYYKGRKPRIGHFTWLLTLTMALETMVVVKYSGSHVKAVAPGFEIWGPWAGCAGVFSLYFASHCYLFYYRNKGDPNKGMPIWLWCLKWASLAPLFLLFRLWAF